ncbi:MAG: DUF4126 domain-containing protein [Pirellulaceae bacterium]
MYETILALAVGIGLAASCGFRVFVPLLIASVAGLLGWMPPSEGFEWLATWPAATALGIATALEIGAYYIPWLDNLLDSISSPTAVAAGVLVVAASAVEVDPLLKWSVAVIAGGGSAGVISLGTAGVRTLSTGFTAGLGNAVVATGEWVSAVLLSLLAIVAPLLAVVVSAVLVVVLGRFAWRLLSRLFRRQAAVEST